MLVCALWLRADWLHRAGYLFTVCPDGSRLAVRDHIKIPLPAQCGHDPELCPPHPSTQPRKEAA